jgi:2-polyprenyl-3-methyl-5-hydroxy-6-metoxy-1,4-benzoquinol methylase
MNIPSLASLRDRIELTATLSRRELADLHFDWEVGFARAIRNSRRESDERTLLFQEAYLGLSKLLRAMRARDGRDLDAPMGFALDSIPRICDLIGRPPKLVLDVGCSTGTLVIALIHRGYDAYGIDLSTDLVTRGQSILAKEVPIAARTRLVAGDFLRHDFGAAQFDFIFSNDVLEHIHPDEASSFLEKCFRLLRPSGSLCLITPNRFTGPGDVSILRLPRGSRAVGLHLREYSLNELWQILTQSGFCEVSSRLYCEGRGRRGTKPRAIYARLKMVTEPWLAILPAEIRVRLMNLMAYSEVVAGKGSDGAAGWQAGDRTLALSSRGPFQEG